MELPKATKLYTNNIQTIANEDKTKVISNPPSKLLSTVTPS